VQRAAGCDSVVELLRHGGGPAGGLASAQWRSWLRRQSAQAAPHRPAALRLMNSGAYPAVSQPLIAETQSPRLLCQSLRHFVFLVPPSHKRDAGDREISFPSPVVWPAWPANDTGPGHHGDGLVNSHLADYELPPRWPAPTRL